MEDKQNNTDTGTNTKLSCTYTLWTHDLNNKDWGINSYKKLCVIDNVSTFWRLFNNFDELWDKNNRYAHYYMMKNDIEPTWEHESNRNGGVCSFKADIHSSLAIWNILNAKMVCNSLNSSSDDINGISISPKNNWAIIKIWNKNKNNDLLQTLSNDIIQKYSNLSIKYKPNSPEY